MKKWYGMPSVDCDAVSEEPDGFHWHYGPQRSDELGGVLICGRPAKRKRFLKKLARSRMLPSVRPLMQRWSCGPVWEFADRNQIINACSRHDEYIWFFRPRLADCCAIPSFDHYTCDDLRSVRLTPWLRPELCSFLALQVAPR